jgi:acyl-coenzyme A thioesterase PaaI-like protein
VTEAQVSSFDAATAIRAGAEPGRFDAELHPDWAIGGKPNGGYLLTLLARSACSVVGTVHPLAVSGHYLRAPNPGAAEVHTEVIRQGRRVSTSRATLWQGGKPCIDALVTSGELHDVDVEWSAGPPPEMPPPADCVTSTTPNFTVELFEHVEILVDPATAPFPTPTGDAVLRYWFRLRDGAQPDVLSLLVAVDCGPPTVFNLAKYGWAPTVELTVLLRGRPSPGWLLVEARTQLLADNWFDEEAAVWDSTGRLVAHARQLALAGTA